MSQEHEYSVLGGLNRAQIGRTIAIIAAAVSSGIVAAFLAAIDLLETLGWIRQLPNIILWPVTAGVVYGALYWLFDRHVWKWPRVASLMRVPDLAGTWDCKGQTINPDGSLGYEWDAEVIIIQSWDRIRVRLKTKQSGSNSLAAAIIYDEADGFRLMYNYRNDPKAGEPELVSHRGYAELTFNKSLQTAEGEYFNGLGRFTFGRMYLTKRAA